MRRTVALILTAVALVSCGDDDSGTATTSTTTATAEPASTTGAVTSTSAAPTQAATTAAPTTQAATTTPAATGDFATFDSPGPDGVNWMQVSTRGGAVLDEQPELCLIVQDGEVGKINSMNFALEWADGEWTLIWNSVDGPYNGPVEGEVDGITVTFHGDAGGIEVRGTVTCFEA